jgi:hypothetical protein
MGHTRADLTLEIYAKKMERSRETGARMDALVKGSWSEKPDLDKIESNRLIADRDRGHVNAANDSELRVAASDPLQSHGAESTGCTNGRERALTA